MKTASEYRALAWNDLRTKFGKSLGIIISAFVIGFVGLFALVLIVTLCESDANMLLVGTIVGGIALLCTVGLLYYYVPVWFFRLVRKDANGSIEEKCPYSKALGTSLIIAVPFVIESIVDALSKLNVGLSSLLFISLSILAIIFIFWWMYAINAMLPYLVHDHHEMSVEQAVKKSICMMDGHKWELFKVDFKIIFLPVFLSLVVLVAVIVLSGIGLNNQTGIVFAGLLGSIIFLFLLFAIFPMTLFARARFYEDLCAEAE